jgi:hypothetical protein
MSEDDGRSTIRPGTHIPFTRATGEELGISHRDLYGPAFRSVFRGVFVDHRIPDSFVVRARAGLLVSPPGGVLSHFTAACLWAPAAPRSAHVHLAYRRQAQVRRPEVRVHRFSYPLERVWRHGLPVTSPGMTFMHLAVRLDLAALTAFGDQLVKRRVIGVDELRSYARAWAHHGGRAGREAAALVRERVDSVPETHLRLLLVLASLPEPAVNVWVENESGVPTFRLDLAYLQVKVAVEYDGRWHDTPEQRQKDEDRRAWLRSRGWIVIVVKAEGLYEKPETTLSQVAGALAGRGVTLAPLSTEYRRYFGRLVFA